MNIERWTVILNSVKQKKKIYLISKFERVLKKCYFYLVKIEMKNSKTWQHSYCCYCMLINFLSGAFSFSSFWFGVFFFFLSITKNKTERRKKKVRLKFWCASSNANTKSMHICISPWGDWWLFCILWRVFVFIINGCWLLLVCWLLVWRICWWISLFRMDFCFVLCCIRSIPHWIICEWLRSRECGAVDVCCSHSPDDAIN